MQNHDITWRLVLPQRQVHQVLRLLGSSSSASHAATASLRIATLAEAHGAALCPHFLPELHVHLVAAAKAGKYVECFPILDELLQEPLQASGGVVRPPERPGHGILWSSEALERYRVR
jgi:L-alanine-DL-glutamate epimerase-like enolase superfamily enzyme